MGLQWEAHTLHNTDSSIQSLWKAHTTQAPPSTVSSRVIMSYLLRELPEHRLEGEAAHADEVVLVEAVVVPHGHDQVRVARQPW